MSLAFESSRRTSLAPFMSSRVHRLEGKVAVRPLGTSCLVYMRINDLPQAKTRPIGGLLGSVCNRLRRTSMEDVFNRIVWNQVSKTPEWCI